ncbi:methyl-accepting chemotaxis sensory transducer [Lacrimispora sphenoides]|nr:methyl-accepting chemotaxis sensory transducer [Lacrimispora sphenoides]
MTATQRTGRLARGELDDDIEPVRGKDESARLIMALQNTIHGLRSYNMDISNVLNAVAAKDLAVRSAVQYQGDFVPIQSALDQILR